MENPDLERLYLETNAKTLAMWETQDGIGSRRAPCYASGSFALATGFQPEIAESVDVLFRELESLTCQDPLADLQPRPGFHFTFVPLTLPLYEKNARLPVKTHQLLDAWSPFAGQVITIRALRLVALPGQLLLAGLPDSPAPAQRKAFCETLLTTHWQDELRLRHDKTPLPAPFWHTTLLRYQADYMPEPLRAFFRARQSLRFGDVCGSLDLRLVNYNWTYSTPVTPGMIAS
ncbi:hypothetical protein [Enterobacter sp. 22466]|uniref:hypothetical protein n=1 Tax=Enterobacter sp. 22466 TaxID=3453924 RepID=UPI003F828986